MKLLNILVLPTLNEEEALKEMLPVLIDKFDKILIIDGNSTDNTAAIASDFDLVFLSQENRGKGTGIREAWQYLINSEMTIKTVSIIDADNTCDVIDILGAIDKIRAENLDIVIGNRLANGRPGVMPRFSFIINWIVSGIISIRVRKRLHDVQSPFWVMTYKAMKILASGVSASKFELEVDMTIQSKYARLNIVEMPINYRERIGETKFSTALRFRNLIVIPWLLLKIRSGLKKGDLNGL